MAACPHCSEDVPGMMTREAHKENVAPHIALAKRLEAELATAKTEVTAASGYKAERDEARKELGKAHRTSLLTSKGITDADVIETMEMIHASKSAAMDEPVAFEDFEAWGATTHTLLASHFTAPPVAGEAPVVPPVRVAPKLPTSDQSAVVPPAPQGKPTPAQVQALFASPEFNALPRDQQDAKFAEIKAQVGR